MGNLSRQKRDRMNAMLESIKSVCDDEEKVMYINEIEKELNGRKYGLIWEKHEEAVDRSMKTCIPVFTECREKEIALHTGKYNFILEGDNLHSLRLLEKTHKNKIDVIYIDPPYGTGGKDFIYDDNFVDKNDGFRHSKWLSFMEERLLIARELMSENGVIFISIDDHEMYALKLLCDIVFGEDCFVANMIWQKKTGASDAKGIATITEYILVYVKESDKIEEIFDRNFEAFDLSRYRYRDEYFKRRGPFYYDSLDRGSVRYSDALNYAITAPDGTELYPNGRTEFSNDGWTWKWSKDKVQWGMENGFIEISRNEKKKSGWSVRYKIYLKVDNEDQPKVKSAPYKNLITSILNANAAADIKNMFGGKTVFQYSKPVELIKLLLNLVKKKDGIVLDFFAGSGTTGQAVLEQNRKDGTERNFILCTNNQNDICEKITYERMKKRIIGYEFKGKKEDILFERKIVLDDLNGKSDIKEKMEAIVEKSKDKYDSIKTSINDGTVRITGSNKYDGQMEGIPANLKYYKTDFIPRAFEKECDSVREALTNHIREMVQLEQGVRIDNKKYILLLSQEDADDLLGENFAAKKGMILYKSAQVSLTARQEKCLEGVKVNIIPDYYFEEELRETGE